MTKPVSIQQRIRILDAQGVSWREIARRLGVSRDTVRKYAIMEDCSPKPAAGKGRRSLIDAHSGTVDSWLSADRLMPRKQRHTARRVYARLVEEEGFKGSYLSVQRYVRKWREEHRPDDDGYLGLDWHGGVMQVDFGEAVATIGGSDVKIHCLVATFPHSNMRYVAAMPGENAECVCEGLAQIFDHIGMAPRVLVPGNATGAGHRVAWNKAAVVRVFAMFCDHYRPGTRFRDPYSGNEKGSVENAVGFLRRNLMVPKPNAESHRQPARHLLSRCDAIAETDHYRSGRPIRELFDEERDELQPLPRVRFDAVEWVERKADKEGNIQIGPGPLPRGPVMARMDPARGTARVRGGDPHHRRQARERPSPLLRQRRDDGQESRHAAAGLGQEAECVGRVAAARRASRRTRAAFRRVGPPSEATWIGNGVLDSFLEDESLFGEFLWAPVSEGGVEPLVVGPPHVVVEVAPQLLDRGVAVPVHELLLQQPVRRLDHGVVIGVALA